jgi:hypothetical protein
LYFLEFLETCTIGWVLICEGGVGVGNESAFFILVGGDGAHLPHPRRSLYALPVHPCPLQRTRNDGTRQAAGQTGPDARQTTHKARHTHPDTEHVTPVCTRYQAGHAGQIVPASGRWTACNASGKVYIFGRLFLSIFIWIYFVEIIDNPYIYGYNIISPDKYGLQPH